MKTSEDLSYWIKYSKNISILAKTVLAVFSIGILIALVTKLGARKNTVGIVTLMLVFLVLFLLSDMMNRSLTEIDKKLKRLEKKDL